MPDLYEPGEFSLADKLLPTEHRAARLAVLQRLYKRDPRLAQEVISYAWPNERHRPYTDVELRQRLAIKARAALNTKVGAELFDELFPSVSAAYDAYEMERQRQAAIEAQNYPAMNFTQPMMASYALGGQQMSQGSTPPVHHRRHYHRHHKAASLDEALMNVLCGLPREKVAGVGLVVHGYTREYSDPSTPEGLEKWWDEQKAARIGTPYDKQVDAAYKYHLIQFARAGSLDHKFFTDEIYSDEPRRVPLNHAQLRELRDIYAKAPAQGPGGVGARQAFLDKTDYLLAHPDAKFFQVEYE